MSNFVPLSLPVSGGSEFNISQTVKHIEEEAPPLSSTVDNIFRMYIVLETFAKIDPTDTVDKLK
jgi:hypothetical protein